MVHRTENSANGWVQVENKKINNAIFAPFYYLREICSFEGQEKVDRYKLGSIDHLCVCVCARVVAWYTVELDYLLSFSRIHRTLLGL